MMTQNKFGVMANTLGLITICLILTFAFIDQLSRHDLPCPLCLLQRTAFAGVGLCVCMNIKDGIKISHYGLLILSALLGFTLSLRQIFLHVLPGDPGYGPLFLGFHLYIWAAVAFIIILALSAVALLLEGSFVANQKTPGCPMFFLMTFFLILILANGISTFIECGIYVCPDNPIHYDLLSTN